MHTKLVTRHMELQRHAFIHMGRCEPMRFFVQELKLSQLPQDTLMLARFLQGMKGEQRSAGCSTMLEAFFDEEAVLWMLTLPNQYWFWKVAHDAAFYQAVCGASGNDDVVSARAVRAAVSSQRKAESHHYEDSEELADLSNEEIGDRLERGICLMQLPCKRVKNWIFYSQSPL